MLGLKMFSFESTFTLISCKMNFYLLSRETFRLALVGAYFAMVTALVFWSPLVYGFRQGLGTLPMLDPRERLFAEFDSALSLLREV